MPKKTTRRDFVIRAAGVGLGALSPFGVFAQEVSDETTEEPTPKTTLRNMSSFHARDWRDYFKTLKNGAILVDITSRVVHYWSEDGKIYRLYPSSIPLSEDLTKRGRTKITRKVFGPSWRPTPAMKKRNPDWPDYIGPGPDNPLGTHALYLSWRYFRIHGTHDVRKIGRRSSNGCIGLYNEHIEELFDLAKVGTQVLLI